MSTLQKRTISLPAEQAEFIDAKVAGGEFASVSEVVRAGLRALQERDRAVERWLREEVVPTYDAVREGRQKTMPVGDAFDRLRAKHGSPSTKTTSTFCGSTTAAVIGRESCRSGCACASQ